MSLLIPFTQSGMPSIFMLNVSVKQALKDRKQEFREGEVTDINGKLN